MRPITPRAAWVIGPAALLAITACLDRSPPSAGEPIRRLTVSAAPAPSHFAAADAEDGDQGYAMQAARIGMPFVVPEMDDVEAAPGAATAVAAACGAGLTSVRLEDPSDACWAAYGSAIVRGDFAQAAAAVRTGCEKYGRADYCELLRGLEDVAGFDASRKGERL